MSGGERIGPYTVAGVLGKGGAGIVYQVSRSGGEALALKLLLKSTPGSLARFKRELETMASLSQHAGFVPVLDSGVCPRGAYLVMPYLRGGTLEERLRQGPLPVLDVIDLGEVLARSLGDAHALGLIHRDLKPANVIYDGVGRALIADLGLAKALDESQDVGLSKTGELRGTLGYASPEQLEDAKHAGPPADVFAIGATLYHCLAGRSPFGHDVAALDAMNRGAEPLRGLRPEAPPWLVNVVERCLRFEASERFSDGAALAVAFEEGAGASTQGGVSRLGYVAGLLLLVLLGAAIVAFSRGGSVSPSPIETPGASSRAPSPARRPSAIASRPPAVQQENVDSPLGRDLGALTSIRPLVRYGGSETVQSAPIERITPLAGGQVLVLDREAILRFYQGTELVAKGWDNECEQGEGRPTLPPQTPRVFAVNPTGAHTLVSLTPRQGRVRSLIDRPKDFLLQNLPGNLATACFTPDGLRVLLGVGRAAMSFDIARNKARMLIRRTKAIVRIAAGPGDQFALATSDGAIETWSAGAGTKATGGVMFRVPNLDRLVVGPTGVIVVSDQAGMIWCSRRNDKAVDQLPGYGRLLGLAFVGKELMVINADRIRVVNVETRTVISEGPLPTGLERCVPASRRYLYCTLKRSPQRLRVIDLERSVVLKAERSHSGAIVAAIDLPGGLIATTSLDLDVRGWTREGEKAWSQLGSFPPRGMTLIGGAGEPERLVVAAGLKVAQFLALASGESAGTVTFPVASVVSVANQASGKPLFGLSDGSVHQGRLGQDPKPWPVFSSPVLRVLALDDGFVCCSKSEVVSVRGGQTMRFRAADIVPTTLSVDGGFLFAGNFAGDLLAWDLTSGRALRRAGIHSGGVRAIHAAGGRLISAGRLRQVAVWRFSAEAGFERVEELELKRSGDRVTFLGPATDPREFLLGTVRGAVFRCEWR